MRLSQKQLNLWLAKWQSRMKLMDWEITVGIVHRKVLEDADGHCDHVLTRKQAILRIASQKDRPDYIKPHDPEYTLVHELSHLHFAPFQYKQEGSLLAFAQEQAIDAFASALIESDRSDPAQ